jgi:hypothetical protein
VTGRSGRGHRRVRSSVAWVVAGLALVVAAVTSCSGEERSASALCARLPDVAGLDEALVRGDLAAIDVHADALRRAEAVAPEDIEVSLEVLSVSVDAIVASAGTAGGSSREAVQAGIDAALPRDQLGTDVLSFNGAAVEEWSLRNCGLDLDSGTTIAAPPSTGGEPGDAEGAPGGSG